VHNAKKFLIEGINGAGKDYVLEQILREFGDEIRLIKFPNNQKIVAQINHLYSLLPHLKYEEQLIILKIIHNLFDLDFRTFNPYKDEKEASKKIWMLNRYYTSNIVYANLHKVWEPYWQENHNLMPIDFCIYLEVQDREKPIYYSLMKEHASTVLAYYDQITPDILFHEGQDLYGRILGNEKSKGNINVVKKIGALQTNTVEDVKMALWAINHSLV